MRPGGAGRGGAAGGAAVGRRAPRSSPPAGRAHGPWAAMGDRERNKKRLLELLQAAGTGNAQCADCGAAGKGAAARAARTGAGPLPSFHTGSRPGPPPDPGMTLSTPSDRGPRPPRL